MKKIRKRRNELASRQARKRRESPWYSTQRLQFSFVERTNVERSGDPAPNTGSLTKIFIRQKTRRETEKMTPSGNEFLEDETKCEIHEALSEGFL